MPRNNQRGLVTAYERRRMRYTIDECLAFIGVAVDEKAAIQITAFCNVNGYDTGLIAFEMSKDENPIDLSDYEDEDEW